MDVYFDFSTVYRASVVIPMTRALDGDELKELLAYYVAAGPKVVPDGLPYVDRHQLYAISGSAAEALRAMDAVHVVPGIGVMGYISLLHFKVESVNSLVEKLQSATENADR